MKNRNALLLLISACQALSLTSLQAAPSASSVSVASKPNILFIITDDQGYGDASCNGNPMLKTPNIDRLAQQSVRFTDFCVNSSCSPTRASLMTGLSHIRLGVTHTAAPRVQMDLKAITLPQVLKAQGYVSGCIGKWHLGEHAGYAPDQRGFDRWVKSPGKPREDRLFDSAMEFMKTTANDGNPFFCYLAPWFPHMASKMGVSPADMAPFVGKVDEDTARFLGMVSNIDKNLGRLMDWLDQQSFAQNTLVVFMSDNGGTQGIDIWNAGMRGCKCTTWWGGTRTMSYWRWPGKWPARDVGALTAVHDIFPTLIELAGGNIPEAAAADQEGHSLTQFLEGKEDPLFSDRMVFQHSGRWVSGLASVHKGAGGGVRWKNYQLVRMRPCDDGDGLCQYNNSGLCKIWNMVLGGATHCTYTKERAGFFWAPTPGNGWALYDLKADPSQDHDIAAKEPQIHDRLLAAYNEWWNSCFFPMIAAGGDAALEERYTPNLAKKNKPATQKEE